jgi:hypothetical protein
MERIDVLQFLAGLMGLITGIGILITSGGLQTPDCCHAAQS